MKRFELIRDVREISEGMMSGMKSEGTIGLTRPGSPVHSLGWDGPCVLKIMKDGQCDCSTDRRETVGQEGHGAGRAQGAAKGVSGWAMRSSVHDRKLAMATLQRAAWGKLH